MASNNSISAKRDFESDHETDDEAEIFQSHNDLIKNVFFFFKL